MNVDGVRTALAKAGDVATRMSRTVVQTPEDAEALRAAVRDVKRHVDAACVYADVVGPMASRAEVLAAVGAQALGACPGCGKKAPRVPRSGFGATSSELCGNCGYAYA